MSQPMTIKPAKKSGKTCSECRHAQTATVNRKWELICIYGRELTPCDLFKDARKSAERGEG